MKKENIKKWVYYNLSDLFRFHLQIPLISIHIDLMTRSFERQYYYILVFEFRVYKWKIQFMWGESDEHKHDRKRD